MKIIYRPKYGYGHTFNYIVDENIARAHKKLTGKKTLTIKDMRAYEVLGITFEKTA